MAAGDAVEITLLKVLASSFKDICSKVLVLEYFYSKIRKSMHQSDKICTDRNIMILLPFDVAYLGASDYINFR